MLTPRLDRIRAWSENCENMLRTNIPPAEGSAMGAHTLYLISHTHWDREWHLTYQQFRLRLVVLMDKLLDLLQSDPDYRHFMLDGQTIVLEDYLAVRPDKEKEIRRLVQAGRLLIGPWHVLPDEFLVSHEALVRNLLLGGQIARRFGARMDVGYVPDPFGHIGQLPQILCGFGLESAVLRRGLSDEPLELWWAAPDGSRVLLCYLRDGYGNISRLPVDRPDAFASMIVFARDSLARHAATSHLLLLNGTDHHEAQPGLPQAMARAAAGGHRDSRLGEDRLIHSTLPDYVTAVRAAGVDFPVVYGELRQCKRHHLLPGVFSSRMWIKQRNTACQVLLERWAEPFSCWAEYVDSEPPTVVFSGTQAIDRLRQPIDLLRLAWRRLLENHPHDSICGCSIDQVHDEMIVRFDEVEQIGEEMVRQSLQALARAVDTSGARALIVFNPTAWPRTDVVEATVELPLGLEGTAPCLVDTQGEETPYEVLGREDGILVDLEVPGAGLQATLAEVAGGWLMDMAVGQVRGWRQGTTAKVDILLSEQGKPDLEAVVKGLAEVEAVLADPVVTTEHLVVRMVPRLHVRFVAHDVPGYGYKAWRLEAQSSHGTLAASGDTRALRIENEAFMVEANPTDGTLTITDRQTGAVYSGLNRFVDGGDRGDEYNYCRPENDHLVSAPVEPPQIRVEAGPTAIARQTLDIGLVYRLPAALSPDRCSRAAELVDVAIHTKVGLSPGVRRADIHTVVDNRAGDHRLRAHFPALLMASSAQYDGHFDVISRPLGLPTEDTSTWVEQPVAEQPQRHFVDMSDGRIGLLVANRGLPEVEVIPGEGQTTIALTLLRCVGWLSRDDLHCRRGHAGPMLPVPGAQCLGAHEFDYALIPHPGDWRAVFSEGHAFAAGLRAVSTGRHAGELPLEATMVAVEPAEFVITAIKQAEDGRGWIVRGYSLADEVLQVGLRPWRRFSRAARVRLDEEWLEALKVESNGRVQFGVHPREITTVRFYEADC
jgi:mannosylglycerate hydrolase